VRERIRDNDRQSVLLLTGPAGCGKSTMVRAVLEMGQCVLSGLTGCPTQIRVLAKSLGINCVFWCARARAQLNLRAVCWRVMQPTCRRSDMPDRSAGTPLLDDPGRFKGPGTPTASHTQTHSQPPAAFAHCGRVLSFSPRCFSFLLLIDCARVERTAAA
jgi:hypothetical protein